MNSINKEIKKLEQDLNRRRELLDSQYQQAKQEFKNKISSPALLGAAFLAGFALFAKSSKNLNVGSALTKLAKPALLPSILPIAAEIYSVLGLVKYAKNFLQKLNLKSDVSKNSSNSENNKS